MASYVCNAVTKLELDRPVPDPDKDRRGGKGRGPKQELVYPLKSEPVDKISFCEKEES